MFVIVIIVVMFVVFVPRLVMLVPGFVMVFMVMIGLRHGASSRDQRKNRQQRKT